MKTLKLSQFAKEVKELANKHGQDYYVIRINYVDGLINVKPNIVLSAYIHTFNWVEGATIKECIDRLIEIKEGPIQHFSDAVMDLPSFDNIA